MPVPKTTHEAVFTIFGVPLRCYRLDNGQAIINADDFHALLEAMANEDAITVDHEGEDMIAFAKWQLGIEP